MERDKSEAHLEKGIMKKVRWEKTKMGKQQFRKAAKKTICWLLILGMLVTLPQFPMTQVSAAEVNTEMIEELGSTELKEVETET
ncbi:MAG: hypothetical protein J5986_06405, partial [Roseburia sp.]|nr:hypothetical protein [Roseburia sp.]